ncbi:DUF1178 family protein [Jannaschia seohaensis]|uniref:DUF1178 family protein n=1 Tax=Jannaschia seohaensis TaxID=475081 RepID=A0A2Y9AN55_9RHOB|nr:DUF1178 family protein [Jannaschia seohaensis]PWJ19239.1 hypothetical protein BCF38_104172 [Jannaschia seohaensis]SSA45901.1 hypothetical protein SAMN05421539_104172 [Jannaschia seohaensis]
MIRYALRCKDGHEFESWFASADAYDALAAKGMVSCAVCGVADVSKALMAPKVAPRSQPEGPSPDEVAKRIAEIRRKVEAEATYVGPRFAAEARAIHEAGESRAIYGEAKPDEARALIEDGIPVAPLPFLPKAKAN